MHNAPIHNKQKHTKQNKFNLQAPKPKPKMVLKLTFTMKHDGFLLLHAKSKVQNVVVVACYV
jgi:hypothetical protein